MPDGNLKSGKAGGAVHEFAGFKLDVSRRVLEREGEPIHLYHRAFDALVLLVEQRERLLTKDELLERLWPNTVVEENNLMRVISDLRKALGTAGDSIVTVARRGYRFAAEVRTSQGPTRSSMARNRRALAVLPFAAMGGSDEDKLLAFGLADALITRLSHLADIAVRPTQSVIRYAEQASAAVEAGRKLKADVVLTGTVRRAGNQVRASVQLFDVESETALWAETFDEPMAGIFALEDSISRRVAHALALELTRVEERALSRRHTENRHAYDLYLRGRYWLSRRVGDWTKQSIACFQEAATIDPNFALAHAGIAEAHLISSIASATMDPKPPRTVVPAARAAAERALLLDPDLSETHAVLGHIAICFDWAWPEAERRFSRAIGLNRNNATARQFYAMALSSIGRADQAVQQILLAREIEPTSMVIRANLGFILYRARRVAEAVEELLTCAALEPQFAYAHFRLGLALQETGRTAEALAAFETLSALPNGEIHGLIGKGHLLAVTGARREAGQVLLRLLEAGRTRYVSDYYIAEIYAGLGQLDLAMERLEKSFDERPVMMISLNANPKFDVLRADPRFADLVRRVGLWDS